MSTKHPEVRMVKVTPALARKYCQDSIWHGQRSLREWHVKELAETMRRGEFTEGTQVHFARYREKLHNINGMHTLHAVIESNQSIELSILTTVCDSEQEIAELYARHDRHLGRTLSDAYEAHGLSERFAMSKTQIGQVDAAVAVILNGFSGNRKKGYDMRSTDERTRLINEYAPLGKRFLDTIKRCPTGSHAALRNAAVMSVGMLTFARNPEKAREFWTQVALGDGLTIGDPRKTLMQWLVANPAKKVGTEVRSRIVTQAWHSFLKGAQVRRFKMPEGHEPVEV
jgi:hypothetical protein